MIDSGKVAKKSYLSRLKTPQMFTSKRVNFVSRSSINKGIMSSMKVSQMFDL